MPYEDESSVIGTYFEQNFEQDEDYIDKLLLDAAKVVPSDEYKKIHESVLQMQETMKKLMEAEKTKGYDYLQSMTWEKFYPQLQKVNHSLFDLINCYRNQEPAEVKQEARQHVSGAVQQADGFLKDAYQKLMGQEQDRTAAYDDSYMDSLLADAEELMPSEEFEEIDEPMQQMQESVQKSDDAISKSVDEAVKAAANAEGDMQVQQSLVALSAANVRATENSNRLLAQLVATQSQKGYADNLEKAAVEQLEEVSRQKLTEWVKNW